MDSPSHPFSASGEAFAGSASPRIRTVFLRGFRRLVQTLGGEPGPLLRDFAIKENLLDGVEAWIPLETHAELLETAAARLDCADFGVRLSAYQSIDVLGPINVMARHSATVGAAVQAISSYLYLHLTGGIARFDAPDPETRRFTIDYRLGAPGTYPQIVGQSLGNAFRITQILLGRPLSQATITFAHSEPPATAYVRHLFGKAIQYDAPLNSIAMPSSLLDRPVAWDDGRLQAAGEAYLQRLSVDRHTPLEAQIVTLIHQLLPTGRCSLERVADVLGHHPRTVQRRLAGAGTDFRALVDGLRRRLALDYVSHTELSLIEIALVLGYAQQSAFNKAFTRWFGKSPGQVRREGVSEPPLA
ncbi:MAG: AraC family transcriptional regulator ligand-binding domain-containing protein [Pseudomonadota bacterium]